MYFALRAYQQIINILTVSPATVTPEVIRRIHLSKNILLSGFYLGVES